MIGAIGQVGRIGLSPRRGPTFSYRPHVRDYLNRVIAADEAAGNMQGLERGVQDAFNAAIEGLVADGLLGVSNDVISQSASVIKAAYFMMGARTLSGCLVPVVGPAPTNINFVSGDYNRKLGLTGNGSTKYLNSQFSADSVAKDNSHFAVYRNSSGAQGRSLIGVLNAGFTYITVMQTSTSQAIYLHGRNFGNLSSNGFIGASSDATNLTTRIAGVTQLTGGALTSAATPALNYFVFARNSGGSPGFQSADTMSFYSIGNALDLTLLEFRINALSAAIAAAIP